MNDDLMESLLDGLDRAEREQTLDMIARQAQEDRAAAARGGQTRNVDVGSRPRAPRGRTGQPPATGG